jgi:4-amino-4-deoxy-L-arabinose transferase-like glycosyltransferase
MKVAKSYLIFILILAIIKFILPFILQSAVYEPHRDEFLYLAEGQHMAWGFMEVPPLLSIFAWLTNVFGGGMFWIKLWPSLFGTATYIIVAKIILTLGGKRFALFLAFLPFIFGVYLRLFFLFQPNTPEVFFWTMIAYSIIRFIQTKKNRWLYILGVSLGLGIMSKYSVAFFALSVFIGLIFTRHQNIFLNKHFWYASFLALIIFLPNLIWQYNHRFPVLHHMQELQQTQLQYVSPLDFLKDQLLMNLPSVFIWLAGLWHVCFTNKGKDYRFLGWAYLTVIVLLLAGHGKNYYSLGAYPVLFAFGAYHLEQFTSVKRKVFRYVFVIIPLAIGIFFTPLALPLFPPQQLAEFYEKTGMAKTGALKWEDQQNHPLPQDFADMLGWKELAEKTENFFNSFPDSIKTNTIIYCRNYGQAGALKFYGKENFFKQNVISDNGSFLLWTPRRLWFKHLIFIGRRMPDKDDEVFQHFQFVTVIDSVTNIYSRQLGDKIIFFQHLDSAGLRIAGEGLNKMKAEFQR